MTEELLEPYLRRRRINKIRRFLPAGGVICDLGCGSEARFLSDISGYISKGYGFDKRIQNREFDNISIMNADICHEIPVQSEHVDCVTMLAVLEHLDDSSRVVAECYRILKPGGTIILTTPSPASKPLLEFLSFKLGIVSPREIQDHKHYYSHGELKKLLEEQGFKDIILNSFELGLNNMAVAFKR